jgi:hypothetical protein
MNNTLRTLRTEAEQAADVLHDLGLHMSRLDPVHASHPVLAEVSAGLRQVAEVVARFSTVLALLADPKLPR